MNPHLRLTRTVVWRLWLSMVRLSGLFCTYKYKCKSMRWRSLLRDRLSVLRKGTYEMGIWCSSLACHAVVVYRCSALPPLAGGAAKCSSPLPLLIHGRAYANKLWGKGALCFHADPCAPHGSSLYITLFSYSNLVLHSSFLVLLSIFGQFALSFSSFE